MTAIYFAYMPKQGYHIPPQLKLLPVFTADVARIAESCCIHCCSALLSLFQSCCSLKSAVGSVRFTFFNLTEQYY